jgi:hypothetical protein
MRLILSAQDAPEVHGEGSNLPFCPFLAPSAGLKGSVMGLGHIFSLSALIDLQFDTHVGMI